MIQNLIRNLGEPAGPETGLQKELGGEVVAGVGAALIKTLSSKKFWQEQMESARKTDHTLQAAVSKFVPKSTSEA